MSGQFTLDDCVQADGVYGDRWTLNISSQTSIVINVTRVASRPSLYYYVVMYYTDVAPAEISHMPGRLSPEVIELIAERFRALAEPARLTILNVLLDGEYTVSELVEATELNQANLSKHLAVLRSSGFVERRKDGLFAYYRVADESVMQLCVIMCGRLEEQAEEQTALLATGVAR